MTDPVATEEIFPCIRADAESDLGYVGGNGRTKPVLMSVRDADDNTTDCVVKLAGHLTEAPLEYLCEWVSWAVARRVGVGCPDMRAVNISPAFAAQLRTDPPSVAGQSVGLAFGSVTCPAPSVGPETELTAELTLQAWRLVALDVLLLNPDRRRANPNLLYDRTHLIAIDHELACRFHLPIIGFNPATDPGRSIVADHILRDALKQRRKPAPIAELLASFASVDDSFFAALLDHTPKEWTTGCASGKLEQMVTVLGTRQSNASTWLPRMVQAVKS